MAVSSYAGSRRRWLTGAAMIAALGAGSAARADEAAAPKRRARGLAVAAAIVPGVIVHGAGHWVAGERATARRLLWAQLIGMGMAAAGGIPIGVTGAADQSMPGLVLLIPGAGVLLTSWFADIYGAAGGARIGGRPALAPPDLELELGYRFVGDPQVSWANLATLGVEARLDRVRIAGAAWLGDGVWRIGGEAAVRMLGGRARRAGRDGTRLDVLARASEQRLDPMVAVATYEVAAAGRYDLGRLGTPLAGSYASLELGLGAEHARYRVDGASSGVASLFLGRFAWGLYLGDGAGSGRRGEVEVFYDHRRDQLAGGLVVAGATNGFFGHIGVEGTAYQGGWGVTAGVDVGAAWVMRLGLRRRFEVLP